MAAEKDEKSMSAEIAAKREMECRRRVAEILNPKKETADKLPVQISYPRNKDQAPFGDRKLGKQVLERGERSTPNITNRVFHATQKPWQRSKLQIIEKRKNGPMTHSRSFMSPPKPYSASTSWGTSAPERVRVSADSISAPKPSLSVSDQAGLNGGKIFCAVCKVDCSSPFNFKQHLSGKKHKAKVKFGHLNKVAAGGIEKKGDNKHPKCELCGILCTDESSLQAHLSGRKHKAKMLDSQVLGQKKMDA